MEMAVGYLNWKPRDFWESTPWEYNTALKGYFDAQAMKNGVKKVKPMSKNELHDLRDKVRELKENGTS